MTPAEGIDAQAKRLRAWFDRTSALNADEAHDVGNILFLLESWLQCLDAEDPPTWVYLWVTDNLVSPTCQPRPLARYRGDAFEWAPGEPTHPSPAIAEMVATLPAMLKMGVRYNATGMGQGNIHEGRSWAPQRPETGPLAFGGDWPGVFIRGDNAAGYAQALKRVLPGVVPSVDRVTIEDLLDLLASSREPTMQVQRVAAYPDVVTFKGPQ